MAKIEYNLSAQLRKLRKSVESSFLAGFSVKTVSERFKLSESLVKEWHDGFVIDLLQSGASKRIFLRELLLNNAPSMILTLTKLAKQNGDEKLAYSASSSVLAFASQFMREDARIMNAEAKAKTITDVDKMMSRTLFDIVDPDDPEGEKKRDDEFAGFATAGGEIPEEVLRAIEEMAIKEAEADAEMPEPDPTGGRSTATPTEVVGRSEDKATVGPEIVSVRGPKVDFWDGLDWSDDGEGDPPSEEDQEPAGTPDS